MCGPGQCNGVGGRVHVACKAYGRRQLRGKRAAIVEIHRLDEPRRDVPGRSERVAMLPRYHVRNSSFPSNNGSGRGNEGQEDQARQQGPARQRP